LNTHCGGIDDGESIQSKDQQEVEGQEAGGKEIDSQEVDGKEIDSKEIGGKETGAEQCDDCLDRGRTVCGSAVRLSGWKLAALQHKTFGVRQ
jgi:hypothetical protein